jgi:hypothetical protein
MVENAQYRRLPPDSCELSRRTGPAKMTLPQDHQQMQRNADLHMRSTVGSNEWFGTFSISLLTSLDIKSLL